MRQEMLRMIGWYGRFDFDLVRIKFESFTVSDNGTF